MDDSVRFCPFCREPFEGLTDCPDHGVPLVPWDEVLVRDRRRVPGMDETLAGHDLRFGRGFLLLGSLLLVVGWLLPAVVDGFRGGVATSGYRLWGLQADYLIVLPASALVAIYAAFSRRTRRALAAARLAIFGALVLDLSALAVAGVHVLRYADALRRTGQQGDVAPGIGVYVTVAGLVVAAYGTWRLGTARETR